MTSFVPIANASLSNDTYGHHDASSPTDTSGIVLYTVVAIVVYVTVVLFTMPLARLRIPVVALFLAILFPPLFFFMCAYLLFLLAITPPVPVVVTTDETPRRVVVLRARSAVDVERSRARV